MDGRSVSEVTPAARSDSAVTTPEQYGRRMARGSLFMVAARVAMLPLGLILTVYLARQLGPNDFGIFAVTASIIWWMQQMTNALFSRTTIKLVTESVDWQRMATGLIQLRLLVGLAAGALVFATSSFIARVLDASALDPALRWFALAIPLFAVTQAHEDTMMARHSFGRSALFPVVFDGSRFAFTLLFVGLGWGVIGAVLGQVVASFAELTYARILFRPPLLARVALPMRRVLNYSAPMFIDGLGKQLMPRLDLWIVQAFINSAAAGFYGAARNALTPLQVITTSLSPLLLATLSHAWHQGHEETARSIMRHTLRLLFCLLPFVALIAAAAPELVRLVFGEAFLPAAPLLTWLSFGSLAGMIITFTAIILAAIDHPGAVAALTVPMLLVSTAGSLVFVPRIGAVGAAATTTLSLWAGMVASLWLVYRTCKVAPEVATILRVVPISIAAYAAITFWQVGGIGVLLQLLLLSVAVLFALFATRLVTLGDVAFARSLQLIPKWGYISDKPKEQTVASHWK